MFNKTSVQMRLNSHSHCGFDNGKKSNDSNEKQPTE